MDELRKIGSNQQHVRDRDVVSLLSDYLELALLKQAKAKAIEPHTDREFVSNAGFWAEALQNQLYVGQVIRLRHFKVLEWIPTSPGLFHTEHAKWERETAMKSHYQQSEDQDHPPAYTKPKKEEGIIELLPSGKIGMIKGGYGSLRVAPKVANKELQYILGASSSGVSHEGIPITLKEHQYTQIISAIKEGRVPLVNLVGRIMILPSELSPIKLVFDREVPKYYLDVEAITVRGYGPTGSALISVAITYGSRADFGRARSFSYSFCSFMPSGKNEELKSAVVWLKDYAVRYSQEKDPLIVGDFDEQFDHFDDVSFPIKEIANGRIPLDKLNLFKDLFNLHINELFMGDKNIFNQSTIGAVGSHATAKGNTFQQAVYTVPESLDYSKLREELIQLQEELRNKAQSAEQFAAIGGVAGAVEAAQKKEGNTVVKNLLAGGKWVFETATKIGVSVVAHLIEQNMKG